MGLTTGGQAPFRATAPHLRTPLSKFVCSDCSLLAYCRMTPEAFIAKWKAVELKERSASQSHFIDLCAVLGEPAPTDVDPTGDWYCFERGATKTTGSDGWADVWKRGHFAWEYKGKRKNLSDALDQLKRYALALQNPPLLVVSDMDRIRIHTNWTNAVSVTHEILLEDIADSDQRKKLKWAFSDPEKLRPGLTRQRLTEQAASEFAELAGSLRSKGLAPPMVAHFINRLVFCMFAEDVDLLPGKMFRRMLEAAVQTPDAFQDMAQRLFQAMRAGGWIGFEQVEWFNGGLFDDDQALPLTKEEIVRVLAVAKLDWAEIDPSILGTLFERGLDPDKRSQLGAHYTDRDKIMLLVEPVLLQPLATEWERCKTSIAEHLAKALAASAPATRTKLRNDAAAEYRAYLDRLRAFRVLDPACGSGNFLYLGLLTLKDLEHRVSVEAETMGLQREFPQIGPASVRGVEINPYAAELARVSVWVGEIQWMRRHGFDVSRQPILKPLDNIECRDAIANADGTEASWPKADVVIGNPPFLGSRLFLRVLGDEYTARLRRLYEGRLSGNVDLVTYWFEKARALVEQQSLRAFGLVATKAIAKGDSRRVLERATGSTRIFNAWTNEPWVVEGAAVRVSLVCVGRTGDSDLPSTVLNGHPVIGINADLTATSNVDATKVRLLDSNRGIVFQGIKAVGPFDVDGDQARAWLKLPLNPNGRPNADVLKRYVDVDDIVGRPTDRWIVDFGTDTPQHTAALYEAPFAHVHTGVRAFRAANREERAAARYWIHQRPRPRLRAAVSQLSRFIVTPETSKHRIFRWVDRSVLPAGSLFVIARDDDTTFGILHSRFHEAWATWLGNRMGQGNDRRYNATRVLETFPFPEGLGPASNVSISSDSRAVAIAQAAHALDDKREAWLNPADLVSVLDEIVPGYPRRIVPLNDEAEAQLRQRTLTGLYNERPTWLVNAHEALDAAVANAYGWPESISESDAVAELFELNNSQGNSIAP
jgi:type II restriction/modification system DNA methylase subunit YeeA